MYQLFSFTTLYTYTFFIIVASVIPVGDPNLVFPSADKITHFVMYVFLAFLASNIFRLKKKVYWRLKSFAYSFGVGIFIEAIQIFVPYRSFEIADVFSNSLGSLLGILIRVI